jgi:hypothetical protein
MVPQPGFELGTHALRMRRFQLTWCRKNKAQMLFLGCLARLRYSGFCAVFVRLGGLWRTKSGTSYEWYFMAMKKLWKMLIGWLKGTEEDAEDMRQW